MASVVPVCTTEEHGLSNIAPEGLNLFRFGNSQDSKEEKDNHVNVIKKINASLASI